MRKHLAISHSAEKLQHDVEAVLFLHEDEVSGGEEVKGKRSDDFLIFSPPPSF